METGLLVQKLSSMLMKFGQKIGQKPIVGQFCLVHHNHKPELEEKVNLSETRLLAPGGSWGEFTQTSLCLSSHGCT